MLKGARGPYVHHRCRVPVADPRNHSQYIVSVRPEQEEKFIKSSENSEFAPAFGGWGGGGHWVGWGSCVSLYKPCKLRVPMSRLGIGQVATLASAPC